MENKQPAIAAELRRRIVSGAYPNGLPGSIALAREFGVNFKTVDKALARLTAEGLIERRRRAGTRVRNGGAIAGNRCIEVIFEGFTSVLSHPFWSDVWLGMVEKLNFYGYRPVLNMLSSDPVTGLLRLDDFAMCDAAGRILLGVSERRLIDAVRNSGVRFITACDPVGDPAIPQVSFDFTSGIGEAVDFLSARGCERIAFVGETSSLVDEGVLQKFAAYRRAVQKYRQLDPALLANTRPLAGGAAGAVDEMLRRVAPDALIAAYDHQLPEIIEGLRRAGLDIPVIGCDGIEVPGVPSLRPVVTAPRRQCGALAAELLIEAIEKRREVRSMRLQARFRQ
ncbi:MAG: GntR family transcriptional regulator [Victivallaceae bacterium]|nr:GntR family transcriptional regulator [Victivallaceae bacterium]